ncbi:hypothetical protein PHMEG_00029315 [Phytophthora megakarya]|uniref:Uncharacterized protein n=1 Tax=Phytophthora megakarya TaxID=4795 RepID=A0A225V310_9STRA|nr:hypothetical protein PHMEG_00029315 [Phytophthora megakarya]
MSITSIFPANSKKTQTTAINASSHKYAYSLARSKDKVRSTNACLAYYRNVKYKLLDKYPTRGTLATPQLQKILSNLTDSKVDQHEKQQLFILPDMFFLCPFKTFFLSMISVYIPN